MRFEVGGSVRTAEDLAVRVDVRNVGDQPVPSLNVTGELFGRREEARVEAAIAPGGKVSVTLRFPREAPRPGVHALVLQLEYPEGTTPDPSGNLPLAREPAYLLLALGEEAPPAVKVTASAVSIDAVGSLPVTLESTDGEAHRVRLRVLAQRGLLAVDPGTEVDVPEKGATTTMVALRRASALRGSSLGVLVLAEAVDGPVARTTAAAGEVKVVAEPGVLPRLRLGLFVLGAVLIAGALLREWWRAPA